MAKKKKKEEEELELPEFDEVEYMHREIAGTRASIAAILFAVPIALVSFLLTKMEVPIIAFFFGLVSAFFLKWVLPLFRVKVENFKRRDWLGHGATFFFTWLAFVILLLNPPISDVTPPTIVVVHVNDAVVSSPSVRVNQSEYLNFSVVATDNVGVASVQIRLSNSSAAQGITYSMIRASSDSSTYVYSLKWASGTYDVKITVIDAGSRATEFDFRLIVASS